MDRKVLEYHNLLSIAVSAAQRAAAFVREAKRPSDPTTWHHKGLNDFVTEIDRESERLVTEHLLDHAPGSRVCAEEFSPDTTSDGLLWVVDPLDGTTNYLHGYPAYAVSIAAVQHGMPQVGVVVDIARDLTYTAVAGGGAWLGENRLQVSSTADPAVALVGTGFPFKAPTLLPRYLEQLSVLMHETSGIRRAGSAALDLVDVALGRFDGFWELQLAPWDVAAGTLLVREAGGVVTNTDGSQDVIKHGSIVAGNPTMHEWLLNKLEAS